MYRTIIVLLLCITHITGSVEFAKKRRDYNISNLLDGRLVESIMVSKHMKNVVYIAFSERTIISKLEETEDQLIATKPLITKLMIRREAVVLWSTPLTDHNNTRNVTLSLSPDGMKLHVIGTVEHGGMLYMQTLSCETGEGGVLSYIPDFQGAIRSTAVDHSGIYICGYTHNRITNFSELQMGKITFSGSVLWKQTNVENSTCDSVSLSNDFIYTTGRTSTNSSTLFKHSINGTLIWGKRIRNTRELSLSPVEMVATDDGIFIKHQFIASIAPVERALLQKFSVEGGTLLWTRRLCRNCEVGEIGVRGLFYGRDKYVYTVVERDGMVVMGRVSRYAGDVEEVLFQGVATWAFWMGGNPLVVFNNGSIVEFRIAHGRAIPDASVGRLEYKMAFSVVTTDIDAVAEYITELTHGGAMKWAFVEGSEERELEVLVVVRGDDDAILEGYIENLKGALKRRDDGKSDMEDVLGVLVEAGDLRVRRYGIEGKGSNVGVVVGVVVGVAVLIVVVVVWFCVTNSFRRIGEGVLLI